MPRKTDLYDHLLGWFQKTHEYIYSSDYLHVACQACGEKVKHSGVYYPPTGRYHCYQPECIFQQRGSGWHSAFDYVKHLEGFTDNFSEVSEFIKRFDKVDAGDEGYRRNNMVTVMPDTKNYKTLYFPEFAIPVTEGTGMLTDQVQEYLTGRGFDLEDLVYRYGFNYVKHFGDDSQGNNLFGYIIIPFRDEYGNFIYYQARDYTNRGHSHRWNNPSKKVYGIGKQQLIYNQQALLHHDDIFICEGVFDALEMSKGTHGSGIAVMGLTVSSFQKYKICRSPAKRLYITFDAGTYDKALELGNILSNCGKDIYVVPVEAVPYIDPKTGKEKFKKDCNELGKEHILSLCEGLTPLSHVSYITSLLNRNK